MSHKILTFAPLHQNGATVFSMLLSQALTYSNMRTLFTFTQVESLAPGYVGVTGLSDPSRSVMQLVKLIDIGSLKNNEILDYACLYEKNAYMMDLSNKTLTDKNQRKIVRHMFRSVPTDVVVCDDSSDSNNMTSKALLEEADQVFLVITPSKKNYVQLKEWLELPHIKHRKDVYVVLNYYNEAVGAVRDIARSIGMKASHVCKLHYNPYITKCTLSGQLHTILPAMHGKDVRVTNLTGDFRELLSCVSSEMMLSKKRR